jgi:tetratricopeptide (TPR) repeat protein
MRMTGPLRLGQAARCLLLVALFLNGAAVLHALPASASEKSEALTKEGISLRRAGRDSEAVKKLQAAYDIAATPRAAAQLGLCLQAVGRWSEADGKLAEAISATNDPWIRKNRITLKDSLEVVKAHVGRVEVIGEPAGALVTVSGINVGKLPLQDAVPVNEGLVDVEVTADGYERDRQRLTITGSSYQRLVVRLAKLQTVAKELPKVKQPATEEHTEVVAMDALTAAPADTSESTPLLKSPWFWGGVAAVVAAGVVTAIVLGSGGTKDPAYTDIGALK